MKTKLLLTLLLCTFIKFAFGTITINGPSTAVSGADITFTTAGETPTTYIDAVYLDYQDSSIPGSIVVNPPQITKSYNPGVSVTTFKTNAFLPQGGPQAMITIAFTVWIQGQTDPTVITKIITITPNTAPPTSSFGLVAGNSPVNSGFQIFFTVTGETSANTVTAATYDAAKSTIPTNVTIGGIQIEHLWENAGMPTVVVAVATINSSVYVPPVICKIAWDLTIKGVTGKVTVSANVTVKSTLTPPPPITGNTIAEQGTFIYGGPAVITGGDISGGGPGTVTYQWQINKLYTGDGYQNISGPGTPGATTATQVSLDFDQISNNSITHSSALMPWIGSVSIRRMVTVGSTVSYSNVINLTQPTYTGTARTIAAATGEANADGKYAVNSTINLTIQNPNSGVTYTWYYLTYTAPNVPIKVVPMGSGTSVQGTVGSVAARPDQIYVYGSDGSYQIFNVPKY